MTLPIVCKGRIAEHITGQELLARSANVMNKLHFWVREKKHRFPEDFMFQLLPEEWNHLKEAFRSQNVILDDNKRGKHSKYVPFVFTEQGVAMLSSVLNSQTAIQVNISIMRVFVKMRQWSANYSGLLKKIEELFEEQSEHSKHIANIYRMIEELVRPAVTSRNPIGYKTTEKP